MRQEELEKIAKDFYPLENQLMERIAFKRGFTESLEMQNKEKEDFFTAEEVDAYADAVMGGCLLRAKEWKERQAKTVYYE